MTSRVLLRRTLVLPILFAAVAACSDDKNGNGPGGGSFTLGTPASTAVTLTAGEATTVTIPVTFSGNMKAVTLTADSVPAGVRIGFQPSTISKGTEQVTVSITTNPDAFIGTRTIKIIAKSEGMTDQVTRIAITTTRTTSYTIANSTSPTAPLSVKRGLSNTFTVTIDRSGGFTGPVDLIAEGLPTGVTMTPVLGVTGNTATVTLTTAPNAAQTTGFNFTLRATNPTMGDRTTTVRVAITPEYTLTNSASTAATAVQIQRTQSGTATININRDTYTGPVTLTASGLPTGITVPTLTDVTGNSATITINTAANAVADTGSFLITGTGGGLQTQTTRVRFRVLAQPGVQVALAAHSAQQDGRDSMYVTVNREGGFTGAVTVTLSGLPAGVTAAPVTSDTGTTVVVPLTISTDAAVGAATVTATVTGAGIATKTATGQLTVASGLLTSGVAVTAADLRGGSSRRYYHINVPAGSTSLTVTFQGGTGDGDIYLRPLSPAGAIACRAEGDGNVETCTVTNPVAGTWYIMVVSFAAYSGVTLRATVAP